MALTVTFIGNGAIAASASAGKSAKPNSQAKNSLQWRTPTKSTKATKSAKATEKPAQFVESADAQPLPAPKESTDAPADPASSPTEESRLKILLTSGERPIERRERRAGRRSRFSDFATSSESTEAGLELDELPAPESESLVPTSEPESALWNEVAPAEFEGPRNAPTGSRGAAQGRWRATPVVRRARQPATRVAEADEENRTSSERIDTDIEDDDDRSIVKIDCAEEQQRLKPIGELTVEIRGKGKNFPEECPLIGDSQESRDWAPTTFTWKASALCHKPLYFEDVQFERYGHTVGRGPFLQAFASGAHFFLSAVALPYKMGMDPPWECVYPLGYYRPGSCAPYMIQPFPVSVRGGLVQAGTVVGIAAVIP